MIGDYLYLDPIPVFSSLKIGPDQYAIKKDPKRRKKGLKGYTEKGCRVNGVAREIIEQLDGSKTENEIVEFFVEKYGLSSGEVQEKIHTVTDGLLEFGFQLVSSTRAGEPKLYHERQSSCCMPSVASIELTNSCNLRCKHCYGSFGVGDPVHFPIEKLKRVLHDFSQEGISIVELTGGDPTAYPYLNEAISACLDEEFATIALLTNGIALKEETIALIARDPSRFFVQIDLHSLSDDYLNWFTGGTNTLGSITKHIELLLNKGIEVVLASVITPKNVEEVYDITKWASDAGVSGLRFSPVIEMGRAKSTQSGALDYIHIEAEEGLLFTEDEQILRFDQLLDESIRDFPGTIRLTNAKSDRINCGALSTHVAVDPTGNIKICAMDSNYFSINIGNVTEKQLRVIYEEKADFITSLAALKDPRPDDPICESCPHVYYCSYCIVRALLTAKENRGKCRWLEERVPQALRDNICI